MLSSQFLSNVRSYTHNIHTSFLTKNRLCQTSVRVLSMLLIAALLMPMFLFGEVQKASASPLNSPMLAIVEPAPVTATPEYYSIPGSLSLTSIANSPLNLFNRLFFSSETDTSGSVIAPEPASLLTPPTVAQLSRDRLNPKNAIGDTNLYSRNFGWGTELVGLPGRGLDAGFSISYNSLVWVKSGSEIVFNPDSSNVTPGFRFGYPVIEPNYTDPLTGASTYLIISPSGGRTEFRLVAGTTDTFETADSSYAQIKVVNASTLVLYGADGTQMLYTLQGGAFRCSQIKDANGNYITINHDANGKLISVTDTLGRVITVNYDAQGQPTTIMQPWQNGTHTYATFSYTNLTINTSFAGLSMVGVSNGMSVKVLQAITFTDGSYTNFEYNTYGQVWRVNNYAADAHKLNHVSVNLSAPAAGQTDCPRYTETRTYAENYNNGAEVVIPNLYQENVSFTPPGGSAMTGTLVQITAPDGTISKTYMMGSGWAEGLPLLSEDWSAGVRQRWSSSTFTQDNTGLSYILNPRVSESKVGDATNTRKTTVTYHAQFGLTNEVKVYDTDQTTVLKRSVTNYNLNTAYTSRRIIGLPSESLLYDGAGALMSRVTYQYDEGNFSGVGQTIAPIMWDGANYGAGFIVGRGNLTSTTRWDVTAPTNTSLAVTSSVKYNTAGLPTNAFDPLGREIKTGYADSFEDNINRNTFAYPTSITDPANNSSFVKYRFDIGANAWAQSPAPAGQTVGKTTSRIYDTLGRLEKEIVNNTGAYTRYVYPTNGVQAQVFSTITDVNNNNTADAADEALSESFTDGAGRVRMSRSEHPGSVGGWSGTLTEYDIMGRTKRTSVPTEVNSSWTPTGDDATRGWLWNEVEYDWKGRVTRQINTDGTDKLTSYAGCGCAGGMLTTIQSELVPRDDQPTVNARRTQKVYEDVLGRTYKTETLNWDGSVYATNKIFFNGTDQVTLDRQYAGPDTSTTFQDTTMTYDGHGRLKTRHRPEQSAGTNTIWNYYVDDRMQQVIDSRGATVNYTYNNHGLVTQVSSTSPNPTTIPVTPTVTYTYDNVGNRTSMTDGMGNVVYEYDQLSKLTAETRQFTDALPDAPLSSNRFKTMYSYSLSGQLKSVTDPYGQTINYAYDKVDRLTSVTGTSFANVTTYASNPQYRAWGAIKGLSYGNGHQISQVFNNRLLASSFILQKTGAGAFTAMSKAYQYNGDGNLRYVQDILNAKFDRLNTYNQVGRIREAKTGAEARGQTAATPLSSNLPYRQSYQFDPFGNMTRKDNRHWGATIGIGVGPLGLSYTYLNNRIQNAIVGQQYAHDADGRLTTADNPDKPTDFTYDASGALVKTVETDWLYETYHSFDGDGKPLKKRFRRYLCDEAGTTCNWVDDPPEYYIRSGVFGGQILSEVNSTGKKLRTFVRGGGAEIAWQTINYVGGITQDVSFMQWDSSGMSRRATAIAGGVYNTSSGTERDPVEADPLGNNMGISNPYTFPKPPLEDRTNNANGIGNMTEDDSTVVNGQRVTCYIDGIVGPCAAAMRMVRNGSADIKQTYGVNLANFGVSRIWMPDSGRTPPPDDPETPDNVIKSYGDAGRWEYAFSSNWEPVKEQQQGSDIDKRLIPARDRLKEILNGENDCSKFFKDKGVAIDVALKALDAMLEKAKFGTLDNPDTGIEQKSDKKNPSTYYDSQGNVNNPSNPPAYRVFGTVTVNQKGPFASLFSKTKIGGYDAGRIRSQVLQLLHELAHVTLDKRGIPIIKNDGPNSGVSSSANTVIIKQACQKEIEASGKR